MSGSPRQQRRAKLKAAGLLPKPERPLMTEREIAILMLAMSGLPIDNESITFAIEANKALRAELGRRILAEFGIHEGDQP